MLAYEGMELLPQDRKLEALHPAYTITDRPELAAEVKAVRQQGFAVSNQESGEDNFGLAVPILLPSGKDWRRRSAWCPRDNLRRSAPWCRCSESLPEASPAGWSAASSPEERSSFHWMESSSLGCVCRHLASLLWPDGEIDRVGKQQGAMDMTLKLGRLGELLTR